MSDFLQQMADASRARAAEIRGRLSDDDLQRLIDAAPPARPLDTSGFILIAEVKRVSPADGVLAQNADAVARALAYATGGASAISMLTEPSRFGGSLDDLRAAVATIGIPVMRKDFLVDTIQILEARALGASGVLLIIKMLDDRALPALLSEALRLGMFVLIESFDEDDLARAGALVQAHRDAGPPILLGLNTRDLRTLKVAPDRLAQLASAFPPGFLRIAESGLETPEDIRAAVRLGYDGALVGSALMRAPDPVALCRDMARIAHTARQEARA